ncbi:MAG: alpha-hydroxy acid oxidase [Actinomycetota bacterium]|nr:alpha-hydroxy-acid oxidizing protein [Actinomycetota bacterium]
MLLDLMDTPLNLEEFEAVAREVLPPAAYGYFAGGADDEITLRENRLAFQRRHIRYRVLRDVRIRDLTTSLLGLDLAHPIVIAPTALAMMAHADGESAIARAAAASGTLQTLSSLSSVRLEDVAAAAPGKPRWFQLYCYEDRSVTEQLVKRAAAAGYSAIVMTVDLPLLGKRERDFRNVFMIPEGVTMANFDDGDPADPGFSITSRIPTPSLSWDDVTWIQSLSPVPVILKGIVRGDDAAQAVEAGVGAVWVSNHGGRQLDTSIPTADALPDVVASVAHRVPVIVDGGVRRGTDVLKALALGADAVAVGRPALWGLASGGEDGVRRVIEMLRDELSLAMALAGCRSLSEIDAGLIA